MGGVANRPRLSKRARVSRHKGKGGKLMKYTVLIYENASDFTARTDEKRKDAYWGAYHAYTQALAEAGVMVGGAGLQPPPLATTVRLKNGKRQVQDGPFAEAKEQLGGYYVIRSEEHTSELQSPCNLVCRLLLEKKKSTTGSLVHG